MPAELRRSRDSNKDMLVSPKRAGRQTGEIVTRELEINTTECQIFQCAKFEHFVIKEVSLS